MTSVTCLSLKNFTIYSQIFNFPVVKCYLYCLPIKATNLLEIQTCSTECLLVLLEKFFSVLNVINTLSDICGIRVMTDTNLLWYFVLPQWNNHGYDTAKMFGAKFTHISPVWLQLRRRCALHMC